MKILVGQKMPNATLSYFGSDGVSHIELTDLLEDKKAVIFALPGAFTNTCSSKHLPGFIEKSSLIKNEGVDEIICISVNDPFVMSKWGETTGANDAGIKMLADPASDFTKSIGTEFTVPPIGFLTGQNAALLLCITKQLFMLIWTTPLAWLLGRALKLFC